MYDAIVRVADCWRQLYFRNWKWATEEHERIYKRLLQAEPRVGADTPCRGCKTEIGYALFFGNGLVCESCLIHTLVHLVDGDEDHRDIVLDLLLGEAGA